MGIQKKTAIIETVNIGQNVTIHEFAVIRRGVRIGNDVIIHPHVVINEDVEIGDGVEIFPGAVIGREPKGAGAVARQPKFERKLIIGPNCSIGPHALIYYGVEIGVNSNIGSYCEIGHPTELAEGKTTIIGRDSTIRSHSVLYQGSTFGSRLVTGHRVTVRENTTAGENLQVGTLCDIQGNCVIGEYVRLISNVHIGKKTKIGNFVWVFPGVVFTNDPTPPSENLIGSTVMDFAAIATMSVILPGVVIGSHALIGANSLVSKDVPDGMLVTGVPAKIIGPTSKIKLKDGSGKPAYPWTKRFHRGYPHEVVENWNKGP